MLVGNTADSIAQRVGLESVPNTYFETASRRAYWASTIGNGQRPIEFESGTVGAVALDIHGHIAAAGSRKSRRHCGARCRPICRLETRRCLVSIIQGLPPIFCAKLGIAAVRATRYCGNYSLPKLLTTIHAALIFRTLFVALFRSLLLQESLAQSWPWTTMESSQCNRQLDSSRQLQHALIRSVRWR